ncbi:hypothetical protein MRB53_004023 [Persea americana]|uniref:Uncharacterized protein n=1 Tax=Persea americana TaxID=3435 RepID=A0ACC2MZD0_PERAE|nr:hypothetical protein MRB53_004023 [Persea americana]
MSAAKKQPHVSLRGASAKEITRDLLLEKVLHERELRNYTRRAEAAALFIQRVWRRYYMTKELARQLQEDFASTRHQRLQIENVECMLACFKILLQSINSTDSKKNFCSLAVGTPEERRTWLYQSQKLVSICSFILAECDKTCSSGRDKLLLTSLAMQLVVALTDPKGLMFRSLYKGWVYRQMIIY